MNCLKLRIADLSLTIRSEDPFPPTFLSERVRAFLNSDASPDGPDIDVVWRNADPRETALGAPVFRPGTIWNMYRKPTDDGYVIVVAYHEEGRLTSNASVLEVDDEWRSAKLTENASKKPWQSNLSLGVGEFLVRTRVVLEGGLMFHSCAVDDGGRGILMAGHSGAGKSTQALIWLKEPGITVLSDDRNIIRRKGDSLIAYGTPWGGTAEIGNNASAPLHLVLILGQGPDNTLQRLEPAEAVPLLLARSFLPYWDSRLVEKALDTAQAIAQSVPVYQFFCRPDASVIPVVRSVL